MISNILYEKETNESGEVIFNWFIPPNKGDRLIDDAGNEVVFVKLSKTGLLCCKRFIDGYKRRHDPDLFDWNNNNNNVLNSQPSNQVQEG